MIGVCICIPCIDLFTEGNQIRLEIKLRHMGKAFNSHSRELCATSYELRATGAVAGIVSIVDIVMGIDIDIDIGSLICRRDLESREPWCPSSTLARSLNVDKSWQIANPSLPPWRKRRHG